MSTSTTLTSLWVEDAGKKVVRVREHYLGFGPTFQCHTYTKESTPCIGPTS